MIDGKVEFMRLQMAGHPATELHAGPDVWSCGEIEDGVSFDFDDTGGWVVAFEDLEKLYLRAKQIREE